MHLFCTQLFFLLPQSVTWNGYDTEHAFAMKGGLVLSRREWVVALLTIVAVPVYLDSPPLLQIALRSLYGTVLPSANGDFLSWLSGAQIYCNQWRSNQIILTLELLKKAARWKEEYNLTETDRPCLVPSPFKALDWTSSKQQQQQPDRVVCISATYSSSSICQKYSMKKNIYLQHSKKIYTTCTQYQWITKQNLIICFKKSFCHGQEVFPEI